jgi:hypothetical protein
MLNLTSIICKTKRPAYRKLNSVKELERLAFSEASQKHPTLNQEYLASRKFQDDSSNGLTRCITTYISLKGGFESRVNNCGIYDSKSKKYRPGSSRKGLPDILATYNGLSLFIEVKVGRDIQSSYQKKVLIEQENAGGNYFLVRNFTEFKHWFDIL